MDVTAWEVTAEITGTIRCAGPLGGLEGTIGDGVTGRCLTLGTDAAGGGACAVVGGAAAAALVVAGALTGRNRGGAASCSISTGDGSDGAGGATARADSDGAGGATGSEGSSDAEAADASAD